MKQFLGLFRRKGNFTTNITRVALGDDYIFYKFRDERFRGVSDEGVSIKKLSNWKLIGLPECTVAMMIYSYCRIKYQSPDTTNNEAIREVAYIQTGSHQKADSVATTSFESLTSAMNSVLRMHGVDTIFTKKDTQAFYNNICKKSPIFKGIDIE